MSWNEQNALTSPPPRSSWRRKVEQVFGIDLRSLAAFRIGMGLLLLSDLFCRGQQIAAHYTDLGVLPRGARIAIYDMGDQTGLRYWWSLHMFSGEYLLQLLLFVVAAVFAGWLLIGYRTRLATIASWILLISLASRNPMLLDGGDVLLQ
ncbi:MAG: hypothetical protein GTO03_07040, partial [Planctomycetales bacterium]|nr:hypothetical protein [Planctomycetales bacterium]